MNYQKELEALQLIDEVDKVPHHTHCAVIDNNDGTYRPMSHKDWPPMQRDVLTKDDIRRIYELTGNTVLVITTLKKRKHD